MRLSGKRTYITIGIGMITVIGNFINENIFTGLSIIDFVQGLLPWVAGIFGRAAIPKK